MNSWVLCLPICVVVWLLLATKALIAVPPAGTQWNLIPELSDEFDTQHANPAGDGLDTSKWWDFHPTWTGRLPSQFSPANSWVEEGKLKLRSTPLVTNMNQVNDQFNDHWIDATAISSRAEAQPGDYFEASIKTAGLSMPSSWWFRQGSKSEIDIIENIGLPSKAGLTHRESEMAYNTHLFDPGANQSVGGEAQMVDELGSPLLSRDNFITYGMWWKSPTEIRYYYNGNEVATVTPARPIDEGLNMVFDMEVFHWVGFPTLESLNDPTKNTMQVDWVRGYRPATNPGPPSNLIDNPSFELSHAGEPSRPDLWADCGKYAGCGSATAFETRSEETAHTGGWSLKIDNAEPNSYTQYKEILTRDNVYSVLPGETIHHEVWVKLTEKLTGSNETLALAIRLNGETSQPRTGAGQAVLADGTLLAEFTDTVNAARELNLNNIFGGEQLNKWVKLEYDFEIPATDSTGKAVDYITTVLFLDNKTATTPSQGILFLDDFSLEVLEGGVPGDFDEDGDVDGADFLRWQRGQSPNPNSEQDLQKWQENQGSTTLPPTIFVAVPEPATGFLLLFGVLAMPSYSTPLICHPANQR